MNIFDTLYDLPDHLKPPLPTVIELAPVEGWIAWRSAGGAEPRDKDENTIDAGCQ